MKSYIKKCVSVFRIKFLYGLQYRIAALAGVACQFAWGFMEILLYKAFYEADAAAFPMEFSQITSYIWLQQAFFRALAVWFFDQDVFDMISLGSLAYELTRPIGLYDFWFMKNMAMRTSQALLRSVPVLIVASLLPYPWGLSLPASPLAFIMAVLSMALAILVTTAIVMMVYIISIHTISPYGIKALIAALGELFTGAVIPLPFFPGGLQRIAELLPFGSGQNVPLRIYSGNIAGGALVQAVGLQLFWLVFLVIAGKLCLKKSMRRVCVQGG